MKPLNNNYNGFDSQKDYELVLANLNYALKSLGSDPSTVMVRNGENSVIVNLGKKEYRTFVFKRLKSIADQLFLQLFTGKGTVSYELAGKKWYIWQTADADTVKWGTTYKQAKKAKSCDILGLLYYFEFLNIVEQYERATA